MIWERTSVGKWKGKEVEKGRSCIKSLLASVLPQPCPAPDRHGLSCLTKHRSTPFLGRSAYAVCAHAGARVQPRGPDRGWDTPRVRGAARGQRRGGREPAVASESRPRPAGLQAQRSGGETGGISPGAESCRRTAAGSTGSCPHLQLTPRLRCGRDVLTSRSSGVLKGHKNARRYYSRQRVTRKS